MENSFRIGGSHYVEPSLKRVTGPSGPTRLEPKVMNVLVCLATHAGEVVPKERLMQAVWPGTFVGDDVLTRAISELRRTFGDDVKEPRFIQTIPKGGYRLIAGVSFDAAEQVTAALGQGTDIAARRSRARTAWAVGLTAVFLIGLAAFSLRVLQGRLRSSGL